MNEKEICEKLEKVLGITIKDYNIFKTALTHRSALGDKKVKQSNERVEFLGDTVLEFVVSKYLYKNFPDASEGKLTKLRSALVCEKTLSEVANEIQLEEFLILGKGEEASGGRKKPYILANAVEAVIGALYLDQGLPTARRFIQKNIISKLPEIIKKKRVVDPKTELQEYVQSLRKTTPRYETISSTGPDHNKKFIVTVKIENRRYLVGEGKTKQEAEENAAKKTLKFIKKFGFAI
uniref:Ribonuclease 3 n=1 Tax=candidate division CPR3 bacterium TaxID=2268181 RepID=A0A7C5USX9_UNCC3